MKKHLLILLIRIQVTNTSFTELIAKPSTDVDDYAPVNRTDNCLLSDSPIWPDSSTLDPCQHPVKSHAQPDYLSEQLIRDRHHGQYPQQFVASAAIPLSTSETQNEIFCARSIDKAYSCDSTRASGKLPKLVNESKSVKPSQEGSQNLTCMVWLPLSLDTARSLRNLSQ